MVVDVVEAAVATTEVAVAAEAMRKVKEAAAAVIKSHPMHSSVC